jgi:hypothetical protein
MTSSVHVVKLATDGQPYHARANWNDDDGEVDLAILQKDRAWHLRLGKSDVSAVAKKLHVEDAEAAKWLREAFRDGGCDRHHFTIYDGDNYLVWKRAAKEGSKMKLRVGSFAMKEDEDVDEARRELLDCAAEAAKGKGGNNEEQQEQIDKLKEQVRQSPNRNIIKGKFCMRVCPA